MSFRAGLAVTVICVSLLLCGLARGAPPTAGSVTAGEDRGFWLEARLKTGASFTAPSPLAPLLGMTPSVFAAPSFIVGYKLGSLIAGVQLNVVSKEIDWEDGGDEEILVLGVGPVVAYQFLNRGPVAVFGELGLGYAHTKIETFYDAEGDGLMLELAFGARYYFAPSFSMGALLGFSSVFVWTEVDSPFGETESEDVDLSIYGAITVAAVW